MNTGTGTKTARMVGGDFDGMALRLDRLFPEIRTPFHTYKRGPLSSVEQSEADYHYVERPSSGTGQDAA